jgi:hypothetical protein
MEIIIGILIMSQEYNGRRPRWLDRDYIPAFTKKG